MNRDEFVRRLQKENGFTLKTNTEVVKSIMKVIPEVLREGDKVILTGFGIFEAKPRKGRTQIDPQGKKIVVPDKTVPKFKPGKDFKEILQE